MKIMYYYYMKAQAQMSTKSAFLRICIIMCDIRRKESFLRGWRSGLHLAQEVARDDDEGPDRQVEEEEASYEAWSEGWRRRRRARTPDDDRWRRRVEVTRRPRSQAGQRQGQEGTANHYYYYYGENG